MNPKDQPTNRPSGSDESASPSTLDAAPPPDDQDVEAPATVPDRPVGKSAAAPVPSPADPGTAAPPGSNAAAAVDTWSPSDCPNLVFGWSVIRTDDPAALRFPTTVNFYTMGPPDPSKLDPQSLLVSATLSSDRRRVTFSVSGESGLSPFLSGTLNYEPGAVTASLTVTDLKYPGNFIARQVLYPSP